VEEVPKPSRIETPPHNGPYLGTVPVRVIPRAESGLPPVTAARLRPDHSRANEAQRRQALERTSCSKGHPWKPETTRVGKDGKRRCRICMNAYNRGRKR
jgi:hypothetical protein